MTRLAIVLVLLVALAVTPLSCQRADIKIGSKKFTESVILGEVLAGLASASGAVAKHYQELGGTRLVFNALVDGQIDVYPEYTGTLREEIFAEQDISSPEELTAALAAQGIAATQPLGFNNTYAIGMQRSRAMELGIRRISDLTQHPDLRIGVTNEFMDRADGWKPLSTAYGLTQTVQGLDHDIAYRQLAAGAIDVIDVYATDAKIRALDLKILEDDRDFFQRYDAVVLFRQDLKARCPKFVSAMQRLENAIDQAQMVDLNHQAELDRLAEAQVAAGFLQQALGIGTETQTESVVTSILVRGVEHLDLVRRSLVPAILVGIPLGILAAKFGGSSHWILGSVGVIQTIPALALLVLLMPLVTRLGGQSIGVGSITAVAALFLYSLLPIVRNTYTGLTDIESQYTESAAALGLSATYRLWKIELPLAARSILAGIKTAAVINVGFATLGALIGAGGYGQPILTGIRLADTQLILQGALPAALLALAVQMIFEWTERWIVPRGLRIIPQP